MAIIDDNSHFGNFPPIENRVLIRVCHFCGSEFKPFSRDRKVAPPTITEANVSHSPAVTASYSYSDIDDPEQE